MASKKLLPLAAMEKILKNAGAQGIIEYLDLCRPIYTKTACYGHFGRDDKDFTWERTDRAPELLRLVEIEEK